VSEPETPAASTTAPAGSEVDSDQLLRQLVSFLEQEIDVNGSLVPKPVVDTSRIAALIPEGNPLHGMKTLEEVAEYVAKTVLIPLDETRINPVFGVGNPNANLLVIGEAPGADEDKRGEPFVGRAGQLLDKILLAIQFKREDVYIANILKSRPPNNRDPTPEEVAAHLPILHKQITLIQPKLILCVGRTAGTSLLGVDSSLSALRGRFHDYHGLPVMVTYHPAALLRNPQWKHSTWQDVQALKARYDELMSSG
jgi:DNA polymerase